MSHIDDARIEAYVDGAYDVLGPELVDEIERRMREEPELAERVREARAVRAAASEILGLAVPGPGAVPPFHELQERAAAGGGPEEESTRRWVRIPPVVGLGWAATVVLALGVGWFVGQNGGAPASFEAPEMEVVGGTQAEDFRADEAAEAGAPPEATAPPDALEEAVASVEDVMVGSDPPPSDARTKSTVEAPNAAAGARLEEAPEEVARRALADAAPGERDVVLDADQERARGAELARMQAEGEASANAPAAAAQLRQSVDQVGAGVTAGGFADHSLHSLALPGLTVVGVGLKAEGALSGLEILHRLPTGDTLSLRYVGLFSETPEPLGVDEARASSENLASISAQIQGAALPRGWHQVVVRKEGRWVVARAPISEAEIRAYLMTLQ
ncbi:MAG: hypothetical protein HKO53_10770 [Gemmatimonadetes bacterium]|nr:hypothetical protein [Gemmatimonadota bacterium]